MPAPPHSEFDDYFTRQIVGTTAPVVMGPRAGLRQVSDRSPRIEAWGDQLRLLGAAARSVVATDPALALAGTPLALEQIPRLRRRILWGGLAAWSVCLGVALWAVFRGVIAR